MPAKNWLVTGVSSGIGKALAEAVIARGDTVVGTVRQEADGAALQALSQERAIPLFLDLTDTGRIPEVIKGVMNNVGQIDVLVNNAGYSLYGALEELGSEAIAHQMNTNFHGPVALMQALIPSMRERGAGNIINISSIAGIMGYAGQPAYCASKFALSGLSESVAGELAPFGVYVTIIEPGAFRTEWTGRSMQRPENPLACYDQPTGRSRKVFETMHGQQIGDPKRAAKVIVDLIELEKPPVHLLLGSDAAKYISSYFKRRLEAVESLKSISLSTDFPN